MKRRHFVAAILGAGAASKLPQDIDPEKTTVSGKFVMQGKDLLLKIKK